MHQHNVPRLFHYEFIFSDHGVYLRLRGRGSPWYYSGGRCLPQRQIYQRQVENVSSTITILLKLTVHVFLKIIDDLFFWLHTAMGFIRKILSLKTKLAEISKM